MAKVETILEKLHQLSKEGKIAWKPTVDPSTFSVVLGEWSEWSAHISRDVLGICHFRLLNSSGDEIDRMSYESSMGNQLIPELYEIARRRALNVDAELDNVLVELNRL